VARATIKFACYDTKFRGFVAFSATKVEIIWQSGKTIALPVTTSCLECSSG
jgi:hypothetical protein